MADDAENNPDAEAKKWFTIMIVAAFLYVATVAAFVISRDVETDNTAVEVQQHGQSR